MRILLTGANGFLGSHILDALVEARRAPVSVLLRQNSDRSFIERRLAAGGVTLHYGSLSDLDAINEAMRDVEVVVHCAGKTKALRLDEYEEANRIGTGNMVRAAEAHAGTVGRFVLISSLAVSGPGTVERPVRETDVPRPVTAYGRSKLGAEEAVRRMRDVPWTILRPAGVYGPRDRDFLPLFRAIKSGFVPLPGGGGRVLSLVYGPDVGDCVCRCLASDDTLGRTYHVAGEPPVYVADLVRAIAGAMHKRVRTMSLPRSAFYAACLLREGLSRVTGRPHILSRQKWPELRESAWVCSTERIRAELDFNGTSLEQGMARTVAWYEGEGWM